MDDRYRQFLLEGERIGSRYALTIPPGAPVGPAGVQLSHRAGASLEFRDYRDYQPGDDLRRLDWSVYARSDRLTVKLYREEVSPHLDLVIDGSRSMALEDTRKLEAALSLAGLFATAAENAGFTHAAWLAGQTVSPIPNSTERPAAWENLDFGWRGTAAQSFENLPPAWRPRGLRVFISDLLFPGEPMRTLAHLTERSASVVVLQLLSEADVTPPDRGNLRLYDSETDETQEIFIDAAAQRDYRDALSRHLENWNRDCRQCGVLMSTLVAETLLRDWNLESLVAAEVLEVH